jgi:hypothetical protein
VYTYSKSRHYYEDLYDHHTVESARDGQAHYEKFKKDIQKKLGPEEDISLPRNAIALNMFYMQVVGNELVDRYNNRDTQIFQWIARDEAKDDQIASARLTNEPSCTHCGKQGLRIIDKSLMHRKDDHEFDDPEEIMFMLSCPYCNKNSAFWEDGEVWQPKPRLCPKCSKEMSHKTTKTKKNIIFTDTCLSCGYIDKDMVPLITKEEKEDIPDPEYEQDRSEYCLLDEEFRSNILELKRGFEEMARLGKEWKEKEDNKHIYDAMKELKKPKIAELSSILAPVLEKAGYNELTLDKPEIGKDVIVGFNCLDTKSERNDYDSKKDLERLIKKTLEPTNWRLMTDGISYRLGYLSGRLKAYEQEEDIKNLVMKNKNLIPKKGTIKPVEKDRTLKGPNGERIIL